MRGTAVRGMRHRLPFIAVVVATQAVALGASTAMFSVIDAFFLSALPYEHADSLVLLWRAAAEGSGGEAHGDLPLSPGDFSDLRESGRSFSGLAALDSEFANVTGAGEPSRAHLLATAGGFFQVLGTRAVLGRLPGPQDERAAAAPIVALGYAYWKQQFGGDPGVIGRRMTIGGKAYEVVGVVPGSFRLVESLGTADPRLSKPVDLWTPLHLGTAAHKRGFRAFVVLGRLKKGVSLAMARDEARAYARSAAERHPETDRGYDLRVVDLSEQLFGRLRPALDALWAATGFVVLIACANLATLLLARGLAGRGDAAVRLALGASRRRIVTESLAESVALSLAGGLVALWVAQAGTRLVTALAPLPVFLAFPAHLDLRVLGFAAAVALVAGVLFGLPPALQAGRLDAAGALRAGPSGLTRRGRRLMFLLVTAEIALTTTLLVGAGLAMRSFTGLLHADLGVRPRGVLTLDLFLPLARYRETPRKVAFLHDLMEDVRRLPGVHAVGMNYGLRFSGADPSNGFAIAGRPPRRPDEVQSANLGLVNAEYFRALGIPLLAGRGFRESDGAAAPAVAIIDQRMARRWFAGEEPLGRRISIATAELATIVGVVGAVRQDAFEDVPRPYVYLPYTQRCMMYTSLAVATHTEAPLRLLPEVRRVIAGLDKDLPISNVSTLDRSYSGALAAQRFTLWLVTALAGIALLLTLVGIHGVMTFVGRRRQAEVGIRMALGAAPRQVFAQAVREGLALSLAGTALGLALAIAAGRLLASLVYGVSATDATTLVTVTAFILLAAFLAYLRPARAMARVDPVRNLRSN